MQALKSSRVGCGKIARETTKAQAQPPRSVSSLLPGSSAQICVEYHEYSKHGVDSHCPGPHNLDWSSQPDLFRRYEGAQLLHLPLGWQDGEGPSYDQVALGQGLGQGQSQGVPSTLPHADHPQDDATATATTPPPPPASGERRPGAGLFSSGYVGRDVHSSGGGGGHHGHPLLPAVSQLLYYALSLSAWKESRRHGADVWSLRVNPSAGNLHPTEAHLILPAMGPGIAGGAPFVAHYAPREHGLEVRAALPPALHAQLLAGLRLPPGALLLGLSSVVWRQAWKYGGRAYRYCALDAGHAAACVAMSARMLRLQLPAGASGPGPMQAQCNSGVADGGGGSWRAVLLDQVLPGQVGALFGLTGPAPDQQQQEQEPGSDDDLAHHHHHHHHKYHRHEHHSSPSPPPPPNGTARAAATGTPGCIPEPETPCCLLALLPPGTPDHDAGAAAPTQQQRRQQDQLQDHPGPCGIEPGVLAAFEALPWRGTPNALCEYHYGVWEEVDAVAAAVASAAAAPAATAPATPSRAGSAAAAEPPPLPGWLQNLEAASPLTARQVVRQRRSAGAFVPHAHPMPRSTFLRLLWAVLPPSASPERAPYPPHPCLEPWSCGPARTSLLLFVHNVLGVAPGLYFLSRSPTHVEALRSRRKPYSGYAWAAPRWCPPGLPLYLLVEGDCTELAARVSCGQDIAARGCFAAAMLSELGPLLEEQGLPGYAAAHAECGALGQALYLEAQALGFRGNGIGCYADDAATSLVNVTGGDLSFASLYHFAVGPARTESRVTSLPAYYHLGAAATTS